MKPILKWSLFFTALGVLFAMGGCRNAPLDQGTPDQVGVFADGLSAESIYQATLSAYANAQAYSDKATLYLSYQISGRNIQEQQPWRLSWQIDRARQQEPLAAEWYNAELRSDGVRTTCYVYDIDSGNLDGQWLVVNESGGAGLSRILSDSIARYFCGGYSEIPLDETPSAMMDRLVPPTLGWLTGKLAWPLLDAKQKMIRLKDARVDDQPCYHLQVGEGPRACELWIDQASKVVRQMTLPTALLDGGVTQSGEVNEIQFFARMHEARFAVVNDLASQPIMPPTGAVPVQQFISVPEAFPCHQIGQRYVALPLFDAQGIELKPEILLGKTSALVWLSGLTASGVMNQLSELKKIAEQVPDLQLFLIYSDDQTDVVQATIPIVDRGFEKAATNLGLKVNWLYDQQLFGAKKLELTTLPGVVVVSPSGNIEYARNTNDPEWGREFVAAVVRTQRGDSVATEMTADYQEYLDRYQKKLQLVSAARWVRTEGMPTLGEGIGQNDVKTVVGQRIWENQELTQPGNIYRSSNKQGDLILLAFDGWRTLCELDAQGKLLNRRSLDLPAGAAASSLRETRGTGKEKCFALFSILNRTVYLFDEDWKLRGQAESPRRDPILECEFATRNGREVLVAAFQNEGILTFDIDGQRQEKLLETPADSLAVHGDQLLVIRRGGAVAFDLKDASLGEEGRALESSLQLTRFVRCGTMPGGCLAIGVDADSNWQVVDLTSQTSSWKPQLVGSQMFESLIEPGMGWTQNGKQNVVAADTFGQVHVLLDNGTKRGTLACDQGLGGIEVVQMGQELTIITSGTRGIMAWRVQ